MPRKLFLSFLGTNNYVECNYFDENDPDNHVDGVKYVQEALIQMYCREFKAEDQYCFFLTDMARKMNWENDGQWNKEEKAYNLKNKGLCRRLEDMNLQGKINPVEIPEGFSSEELWKIFESVFSCIEDGDEVYLDITHAFRSLPLLGLVLLNYAKTLKNIEVKGIYYGAFEKLGPATKVAQMNQQDRNAPVLNLLSVSVLQDWTNAAYEFIHYGKVKNLVSLTDQEIKPILSESKGQDEVANGLRVVNKVLKELATALSTNRGKVIYEGIKYNSLKEKIDLFTKEETFIKPLNGILKKLKEKVGEFEENDPMHWLKSTQWCIEHEMYQQATTQLQEGVLTWLCIKLSEINDFFDWKKKEPRNLLSSVFTIISQKINENAWRNEAEKYRCFTRELVQHKFIRKLATDFSALTQLRNDINHGGYNDDNTIAANKAIEKCKELFENFQSADWPSSLEIIFSPLLNLSNHPIATWTEKQLAEARRLYGDVEDLPFPLIPPDMTEEELEKLVEEYLQEIKQRAPAAVHIMGEMTFTCRLVQKLKEAGITCLASTTERLVQEVDGKKITEFRFVRFRKY